MIPWKRPTSHRLQVLPALMLLGGLIVAAAAPAPHNLGGVVMLIAGVTAATVATVRIVRNQVGSDPPRLHTMIVMFLLCLGFFGGSNIISLAAINGLGYGIVAGSVAVGVGLFGWSVTGMRPTSFDARLGDPQIVGLSLLTAALGLEAVSLLTMTETPALILLIGAWALGGIGMGLAYNRIFSESVDRLPPEQTYIGAIAVEFSEYSGQAIGTLLTGGTYSLATSLRMPSHTWIGAGFVLLAIAAVIGITARLKRRRTRLPSATSS
jgi:hypothetical protein